MSAMISRQISRDKKMARTLSKGGWLQRTQIAHSRLLHFFIIDFCFFLKIAFAVSFG
jgi:hypothetical protein